MRECKRVGQFLTLGITNEPLEKPDRILHFREWSTPFIYSLDGCQQLRELTGFRHKGILVHETANGKGCLFFGQVTSTLEQLNV